MNIIATVAAPVVALGASHVLDSLKDKMPTEKLRMAAGLAAYGLETFANTSPLALAYQALQAEEEGA